MFQSISRKDNCLNNAFIEIFFAILKQEIYYDKTYNSYLELKRTIDKYIKYYNEDRIKQRLGFKNPV
ncbi:IS3 family transposase [Mycoplasma bradburyae]|uniref:IS3 family transposase n=1 Tax=Mycoplasma bradburyae TaxID=2963128 RepID=UPI003A900D2D